MLGDIMLDNLEEWCNGIELVCSLGHLGVNSLVRNPDKSSSKPLSGTTGIVGYTFRNNTGKTIEYLTEEVTFDKESGKYVGKQVVKEWANGTEIDLTKVYTTHLLKRPELNCKCKNGVLIFGNNAKSKLLSDRINLITSTLSNPDILNSRYSDEDIKKLKDELNKLANELAGTTYMRCTTKGQSVHDDRYKKVISVETTDGYKVIDERYIKTFGLLNNSLIGDTYGKLKASHKKQDKAELLNKAGIVLGDGLLKKIENRIKSRN